MDPARGTYHWSDSTGIKYRPFRAASGVGFVPIMTKEYMQLLQAEALEMQNKTGALALVNSIHQTATGHFAIPGAELEVLQSLNYSYGGVGTEGDALAPSGSGYCLGPCGGGAASAMMTSTGGMAPGAVVPASRIYQLENGREMQDRVPMNASKLVSRYQ